MPESLILFLDGTGDDATDLYDSLSWDSELRGRVQRAPAAAPDGTLGVGLTQLLVALESGGMATAFASVLVAWIKRRSGSVRVKVTRNDGTTFELTAERVHGLNAEDLQKQAAQLAAMAWPCEATVAPPGEAQAAGTA